MTFMAEVRELSTPMERKQAHQNENEGLACDKSISKYNKVNVLADSKSIRQFNFDDSTVQNVFFFLLKKLDQKVFEFF